MIGLIINYVAWYIFMFISVTWLLVLLRNRNNMKNMGENNSWFPKVSVIIPAYNEEQYLAKTIKSMLSLDYPRKLLDIIVVNDCSKDGTREIAEGFIPQGVRAFSNRKNMGKAASLNMVLPLCKGELIACIDADSTAEPSILKKMTGYFSNPKVAAVTPALKIENPRNMLEKAQYAEYILNIFLRKMLALFDSVHVTPGVFSIYRKKVLLDVGGFDKDNLTEDMEIALRIHQAGYSIENNLKAISYTACPEKIGELYHQRVRWYRGGLQNAIKYRNMLFNRKYGNLGVFFLPFNLIIIIAVVAIFCLLLLSYAQSAISYIWRFNLVGWDVIGMMPKEMTIGSAANSIWIYVLNTPMTLWALGTLMSLFLIYLSFRVTGESLKKNRLSYLIYVFIFPFIYMIFWAVAFFSELLGRKRKW